MAGHQLELVMEAGHLLESAMEAGLLEEILQMEVQAAGHQLELVMETEHQLESVMEAERQYRVLEERHLEVALPMEMPEVGQLGGGFLEGILPMEVQESAHQWE